MWHKIWESLTRKHASNIVEGGENDNKMQVIRLQIKTTFKVD